ncbi:MULTISPECIES: DUF4181 domain-containing protein [unclassified Niallia]|uniref:DUF4181 domain-containing protein n=1 Tax=Niallia TaxID=2837506 RepID=UPI001EDA1828|nr:MULTISPECIES: DUF4181 domain-containing protein [unclassified Niallia]MCM3034008.1 DUF4181 domain-containing protein [Niallia sp. MER 6]MDL0436205.1 DUF4181 domain-containing protein [Niallia sp. SS-2023]UPO86062.1 DUF4181 domain-containing protein [Niallia sp. Man26]
MKYIILFAIVWAGVYLIEKLLFKLLGVQKKKVSKTEGKKADIFGRVIIAILIVCTSPFILDADSSFIWPAYLLVIFGYEAFMEWKYIKGSKQYIGTIIFMIIFGVAFYLAIYFEWILKV